MSLLTPRTIVITTDKSSCNGTELTVLDDDMMDEYTDSGEPRKRRRLTHLSPDEKFLRRKLKNRVAAQTARDRKKALMSEMEIKIAQLEAEKKKLQDENTTLKIQSDSLVTENTELKQRLGQCNDGKTDLATSDKLETKSHRSAASAVPLPKEQISTPLRWMEQYKACCLLLSTLLCIVYCTNQNKVQQQLSSSRKRKQSNPSRVSTSTTEGQGQMVLNGHPVVVKIVDKPTNTQKCVINNNRNITLKRVTTQNSIVPTTNCVQNQNSEVIQNQPSFQTPSINITDMETQHQNLNQNSDMNDLDDFHLWDDLDSLISENFISQLTEDNVSKPISQNQCVQHVSPNSADGNNTRKRKISEINEYISEEGFLSDSGLGSDSEALSPKSEVSNCSDDIWQESFSELFPGLI
ncbi:hypothetical protein LOTGIDRAFT_232105 [Lottia gigantea]|uniref:X-box-binding protein 1 n=1 Tax=Lottia gigantea TaxID=225164 RepID=V4AL61_LOTGI|nr:hypothetical protein LOTGIDRAFT_232105 [Lottia gigantea]ESO95495.1 hypothetical protein LOTGIDRAFT_232105 [Lottia gigantea]